MTSLAAADWSKPCAKCGHGYHYHFDTVESAGIASTCMECGCERRGDVLPPGKVAILQTDEFPETWKLLADVDISEEYAIDQARIYHTGVEFILATAYGCSCWDGEWCAHRFATLSELYRSALYDEREHCITWAGADELMSQAYRGAREGGFTPKGSR